MTIKEGTKSYLLAGAIFCLAAGLVAFWFLYQPQQYLEVDFLDVGQGDAALIKTPHGKTILVDGGPDKKILTRLSENLPFWQNNLDLIILTHPHDDHFGGLVDVLQRYQVKNLLFTDVDCKDLAYQNFLKVVAAKKINKLIIAGQDKFSLDNVDFSVLYPLTKISGQSFSNLNNTSIVFKLHYQAINFLLTGDAEAKVEQELINNKTDLSAQVLKVGHHGSDTSSTENFLKLVKPIMAVISVGQNNKYNHPVPIILKRLERLGIKFLRTDQSGTIKSLTNGHWLNLANTCLIGNCPL